jgi:hypothetical protein
MAHLIPPDYPPGTSPGEALIFDALKPPEMAPTWTVLHSLHLPEHIRQVEGEADFVVLMPGLGVLCLEVKSHLQADYVEGAWYLGRGGAPDYRGPFRQAEGAARSLKKKVASVMPTARKILFWPGVVFTHCVPGVAAATGDWHRWQLLTSADLDRVPLDHLLEQVMRSARGHVASVEQARWFDPSSALPSKTDCEHIRRVLRPDVHFLPATVAIRARRAEEIRKFTDEQIDVLEGLDGVNERALIQGPAGTGKTVLAFEEARRVSLEGGRPLLLCFNQQLAAHLRSQAKVMALSGCEISTLHSLLRKIASDRGPQAYPDVAATDYWARVLPDLALGVLLDQGPPFDFLIVDEAQDLAETAYLDVLDALLEGELASGRWRMFGDFERQAIFASQPAEAVERILARASRIARFRLRRNCRNIPRVAEYVVRLGGLDPGYSRILRPDTGPDGTPRTSFYGSQKHQADLLRSVLRELLTSGEFDAEDVVVLSPVVESCAKRLACESGGAALQPLPRHRKGAPSYGTIAAFKGLEAPAVVLTDIEEVASQQAQRIFYVGTSRATDRLRVLARDGLQIELARMIAGGPPNA